MDRFLFAKNVNHFNIARRMNIMRALRTLIKHRCGRVRDALVVRLFSSSVFIILINACVCSYLRLYHRISLRIQCTIGAAVYKYYTVRVNVIVMLLQ